MAIEDYSQVIELDPGDTRVRYNRGLAHAELGRYDEALEDFNAIIDDDPDNAAAYMASAYAHTMLGRHQDVVRDYDRLVELLPDDLSIREERRQALERAEAERG